jgi:hypothetical protein
VLISASNKDDKVDLSVTLNNEVITLPTILSTSDEYLQALFATTTATLSSPSINWIPASTQLVVGAAPDNRWIKAASTIRQYAKLTFVRLDRTILVVDKEGDISADPGAQPRAGAAPRRGGSVPDALDDVTRVTRGKYRDYRLTVERIKNKAFRNLLRLHFSSTNPTHGWQRPTEKELKQKLVKLNAAVKESPLISDAPELNDSINGFFSSFGELLSKTYPEGKRVKKVGRKTALEESVEQLITLKQSQISGLLVDFRLELTRHFHSNLTRLIVA